MEHTSQLHTLLLQLQAQMRTKVSPSPDAFVMGPDVQQRLASELEPHKHHALRIDLQEFNGMKILDGPEGHIGFVWRV